MLIKQKRPSLPRNLALGIFGELPIVFPTKKICYTSFIPPAMLKENCLLKTFVRTLILMTHVSLYLFSLLELMNLDLSKASGPDSIPVVVLNNCEPELSYILAELFNKCLKESCFPDCWKVSLVLPVFENVEERSTAKN